MTGYRNKERLRELYHEDGLSTRKIGDKFSVSKTTIRNWMDKFGIEREKPNNKKPPSYSINKNGRMKWQHRQGGEKWNVLEHRLLAVAEFGYDSVSNSVVHHRNHIPWDNRPGNLKLFDSQSEHRKHHIQIERETKFLAETLGLN